MSHNLEHTTIAALATPPGTGGLAVIRVSGPRAEELLRTLFVPAGQKKEMRERRFTYGHLVHQGQTLDECMAVLMKAPRSYTREDVAELQVHGGEQVAHQVLAALYALGAAPAAPGEFTRRAFENGRLDLSQAEAVMQLVSASGAQAARAALRQLQGGTLRFVQDAQTELIGLMAGVTAAIDYPEEIDQQEAVGQLAPALLALSERLRAACDLRGARILQEGLQVALCGKPNAGKSSLLNALLLENRAIVTDIPGTTRDTVEGSIDLDGIRVRLRDTAGIRESQDSVERLGVQRALDAINSADLRLMVLDMEQGPEAEDEAILRLIAGRDNLYLLNKSDLAPHAAYPAWLKEHEDIPENQLLTVSARSGEGLDELRRRLRAAAGQPGLNSLTLERHMRLADQAAQALARAAQAMEDDLPLDLCAVDMNEALALLGQVTGDNYSEALLDEVFSRFCVGK
ncbi:MAG: tRNA uridine-5-carboxymethylaminomethyl(34) synthesis GTPase MnmE [Clostridiales bacterium]|mgnify:CR=1 FL=1|nr:tRNA uridine-5-carboxymethylaminomethyl(34) synthesis GTPase MnmE [Clostridiales bacterium]